MTIKSSATLIEEYEIEGKHGPFYTGGNVESTRNALLCQTVEYIAQLSPETFTVVNCVGNTADCDGDDIYTFAATESLIATAHKSGLIRLWDTAEANRLLKVWKSLHSGPVPTLKFIGVDGLLCSAGSDGSVRIWNWQRQSCECLLRGCNGVVNALTLAPPLQAGDHSFELFASGDDGRILSWTVNGKPLTTYAEHLSKVTCVLVRNEYLLSSGRDKVVLLWKRGTSKSLHTLMVLECIETMELMPMRFRLPDFKAEPERMYVAVAGESGRVRVWDVEAAREVYAQPSLMTNTQPIVKITLSKEPKLEHENEEIVTQHNHPHKLIVVTADHNIMLYNIKGFVCIQHLVGYWDDILDLAIVGAEGEFVAVATNSPDIKLYRNQMSPNSEYRKIGGGGEGGRSCGDGGGGGALTVTNCQMLRGHTDIVMVLHCPTRTHPNVLVSGAKDNEVRVWRMRNSQMTVMQCIATGAGHTGSVTGVYLTNRHLFSVSQDMCMKVWSVSKDISTSKESRSELNNSSIKCLRTLVAHSKDINAVTVSPNNKIICTSSQDKCAKLWSTDGDYKLLSTLRGHKRGVWSACFSPVDQVLATSSADCTVKLWSMADYSCVKTFEGGHDASILRVYILPNGMQMLTAGADGLLLLWHLKSCECERRMDAHEGRIWALDVYCGDSASKAGTSSAAAAPASWLVTGGADSQLLRWRNVTAEKRAEREQARRKAVHDEQLLDNLLQKQDHVQALRMALQLRKPRRALHIVQSMAASNISELKTALIDLTADQRHDVLQYAVDWNTNTRNCFAAQTVLRILLDDELRRSQQEKKESEREAAEFHGSEGLIAATLPYTERHFKRLTKLVHDLNLMEYTMKCMQPHSA